MAFDKETEETRNTLEIAFEKLKEGMQKLVLQGIESEFEIIKDNNFGSVFNEHCRFKAIDNEDELHFNSVKFDEGDINTLLDKTFRYMGINGVDFDKDWVDYDFNGSFGEDRKSQEEKKEMIDEIKSSDYHGIISLTAKNIETIDNYNENFKKIDYVFSYINNDNNKLEITDKNDNVITNKKTENFDLASFFTNEEYIKEYVDNLEKEKNLNEENIEKLPKENMIQKEQDPPFVMYKYDNNFGVIVTDQHKIDYYDEYVETDEKPFRIHIVKFDEKGNYEVDPYTKATERTNYKGGTYYEERITEQSLDEVKKIMDMVKGFEKTKILSGEELKEKERDFFNKSLEKGTEENNTLMNRIKRSYTRENELILQDLKKLFTENFKEEAVGISNVDFNKNMTRNFKERGVKSFDDYIKLKDKFSDEKINAILKNEANFEKEVFKEIDSYLVHKDGKVIMPKEEKILDLLYGKEVFSTSDRLKEMHKELEENIDKKIKFFKKDLNLSNEDMLKIFDEEYNVPEFLVFTESGVAYLSDKNREIDDKASAELKEIAEIKGIEDFDNVRNFEKIDNLTIVYIDKNKDFKNYVGYEDYIKETSEELDKRLTQRYKNIEENLKNDLLKILEYDYRISPQHYKEKDYDNFEKKLNDRIKTLEKLDKADKNIHKEKSIEIEKTNKNDIEIDM